MQILLSESSMFFQIHPVLFTNHHHHLKLTAEGCNTSRRELNYLRKVEEIIRQQWEHQGNHVGEGEKTHGKITQG